MFPCRSPHPSHSCTVAWSGRPDRAATGWRCGSATTSGRTPTLDRRGQRGRPPPRRPWRRRRRPGGADDHQPGRVRGRRPRASASSARRPCCSAPPGRPVEVDHAARAHRAPPRRSPTARPPRCWPTGSAAARHRPRRHRHGRGARTATGHRPAAPTRAADADEAVLVFSSGTTGLPKAVRHTPPLDGRATAHWVDGLGLAPTTASRWPRPRRTSSACSTCSPPPRPAPPCGCTAASTSTRCWAASRPTASRSRWRSRRSRSRMANHPDLERYDLSSLRYIMWGATPVTRERRRDGHPPHRRALAPGLRRQRAAGHRLQPGRPTRRAGGSTRPACRPSGVELRVVDLDTGAVLAPGETGEIQVRSASVMAGLPARRRPTTRPSPTAGTAPATSAGSSPRAGSTSPTGPRR